MSYINEFPNSYQISQDDRIRSLIHDLRADERKYVEESTRRRMLKNASELRLLRQNEMLLQDDSQAYDFDPLGANRW